MTDDATLSDFQPAESDDVDDGAAELDEGDVAETSETDTDEAEPEPAPSDDTDSRTFANSSKSTYAWGSYTCTRCESETDRVWRLEGEFVCPDCKSW